MGMEKRRQRYLELIRGYRLIDNTFMSVVFADKECTRLLLRCILERDDLGILPIRTQEELRNLWGRSVRLDILATDVHGSLYNIEAQQIK